jgi:ABC-2 type transport system ATP-binding protein
MPCIEARGLRKAFGATRALDGVDFEVGEGRIVGLIGPNGAGKTTALHAILGLTAYQGELSVLGRDPWRERESLARDVAFIADVAILPRWIRARQAIDFVEGVHPRFDRARAEAFLAGTGVRPATRVRELSKGMIVQLHLALVMAIDARLLVLDEPTLGLDLIVRKRFYDTLLEGFLDGRRTILVTTHQVEEIEDVLTDVVFLDRGRVLLASGVEELTQRWAELEVRADRLEAARALGPIHERQRFGRGMLLFENADRGRLAELGEVRAPRLGDLFVALVERAAAAREVRS